MINLIFFAMRFPPEHVGTARYAASLAEGLAKRGVQVTVIAPAYARHHPEDGSLGYQVRRIPGGHHSFVPLRYPFARAALRQALDELHPDVLWATNGMATRVVGTLIGELNVPVIGSVHGTDIATRLPGRSPRTWLESIPQRRFYDHSDRLLANSRFTYDLALQKGIDPDKLQVVYLGVEMSRDMESARLRARKNHPELAGRRIVLTVARLVEQKGHKILIEALDRVLATRPDVLHIIVGDGPEKDALAAQIQRLGRKDSILLVGFQSQDVIEDYYALAQIFALTSHTTHSRVEGLGFVFLEAAARGLPVVGTRHGGIPEVILDGKTGFLVDPGRPQEIAQRIGRLFDDGALCQTLGDNARSHTERRFSMERMLDESKEILTELKRGRENNRARKQ